MICAIIPVKGRHELLTYTIQRMLHKNGINKVICVVSTFDDEYICKLHVDPDDVIYHPNNPLAMKWNAGWEHALRKYDPDVYVFAGSSDWLSDNWLTHLMPYLDEFDMVGKPDMYLYDVGRYGRRLCHWAGYTNERAGETIGIGRLLRKQIVHKMKGRPFRDDLDNSLDFSMEKKVLMNDGKVKLIRDEEVQSLSLSCHLWGNKHQFEDHWRGRMPSTPMGDGSEWIRQHFIEALQFRAGQI